MLMDTGCAIFVTIPPLKVLMLKDTQNQDISQLNVCSMLYCSICDDKLFLNAYSIDFEL